MISPVILFNLVIGLIAALQTFALPFIVFANKLDANSIGGPLNSALMYSVQLYAVAFQQFRMGYAAAMAWVLCGDHLLSVRDCAPALEAIRALRVDGATSPETQGVAQSTVEQIECRLERAGERRSRVAADDWFGDANGKPLPLFAVVILRHHLRAADLLAGRHLAQGARRSLCRSTGLVAAAVDVEQLPRRPWSNFPSGGIWRTTITMAVPVAIGMTFSSATVAYAFSRLRWRGRDLVFYLILAL